MIPIDILTAKTFGMIPVLKWGTYLPDPFLTVFNN